MNIVEPVAEELTDHINLERTIPFLDHPFVINMVDSYRSSLDLDELIEYDEYDHWTRNISSSDDYQLKNKILSTTEGSVPVLLEEVGRIDINKDSLIKFVTCGKVKDEDCITFRSTPDYIIQNVPIETTRKSREMYWLKETCDTGYHKIAKLIYGSINIKNNASKVNKKIKSYSKRVDSSIASMEK